MTKQFQVVSYDHTMVDNSILSDVLVSNNGKEYLLRVVLTNERCQILEYDNNRFCTIVANVDFCKNSSLTDVPEQYVGIVSNALSYFISNYIHQQDPAYLYEQFGKWALTVTVTRPVTNEELASAIKDFVKAHDVLHDLIESTYDNGEQTFAINNKYYPLPVSLDAFDFYEWQEEALRILTD